MDNADKQEIASIVSAALDARLGTQGTTPAPTVAPVASIVRFKDEMTESIAQAVYGYVCAHPEATSAEITEALALPKHWFRNPKVLANGKRVTPGLAFMRARAGVGVVGEKVAKHAKAKVDTEATPEQDAAKRAIAIRVAEHLEHALDDGLASGLLYEKAKSTKTLRNLAATVRARVGL